MKTLSIIKCFLKKKCLKLRFKIINRTRFSYIPYIYKIKLFHSLGAVNINAWSPSDALNLKLGQLSKVLSLEFLNHILTRACVSLEKLNKTVQNP